MKVCRLVSAAEMAREVWGAMALMQEVKEKAALVPSRRVYC